MRRALFLLFAWVVLLKVPAPARGAISITGLAIVSESCGARGNNAADPDEKISLAVSFRNDGPAAVTWGVATLVENAGVIVLSDPQELGKMAVGASVIRPFEFVARGACGSVITLAITRTTWTSCWWRRTARRSS